MTGGGRLGAFGMLLLLALLVPLALALEARAPRLQNESAPLLPSPALVRPLLLGYHPLAADLYWLRTIQYFGTHMQGDAQFPHLYSLVDFVTSLDPRFLEAYQHGGLFLVIAKRYPEAIRIYEKGIAANPTRWELAYELGRLYFLDLRDDRKALEWWQVADRLPDRPEYLPRFLARLYDRTGSLELAYELWLRMYETAGNEWVHKTAERELARIRRQLRAAQAR
jgi:tetratricopeptide (TPR) repeat protein